MKRAKAARGKSRHNTGHTFESKAKNIASRPGFKARSKGQTRMQAARSVVGSLKAQGKIK